MSVASGPAGDEPVTGPLSSIEIPAGRTGGTNGRLDPDGRPLALRDLRPAPQRVVPEYVYDPRRQVAVAPDGRPLAPDLKKDWTTIEGTHTDGDGGDNEMWDWEEVR